MHTLFYQPKTMGRFCGSRLLIKNICIGYYKQESHDVWLNAKGSSSNYPELCKCACLDVFFESQILGRHKFIEPTSNNFEKLINQPFSGFPYQNHNRNTSLIYSKNPLSVFPDVYQNKARVSNFHPVQHRNNKI